MERSNESELNLLIVRVHQRFDDPQRVRVRMMLTLFDWRICGRHRLPSVGRQSETGSSGGEGGIRSQEGLDRSVSYRRSVAAFGYFARLCRRALPKIAQTSGVVEFVGNMH